MTIVIAVILVLSALVFPVFSRIRNKGNQTVCQSNLRQIFMAMRQYVTDDNSNFPLWGSWQQGLLPYVNNSQIFLCPAQDHPHSNSTGAFTDDDYTMAVFRLNDFPKILSFSDSLKSATTGSNESTVEFASKTLMTLDTPHEISFREVDVPSSCGLKYPTGNSITALKSSTVHLGGANAVFCDGHIKWLTPEAVVESECEAGPYRHSTSN